MQLTSETGRWRRAVTGGVVIGLHILVLFGLLAASGTLVAVRLPMPAAKLLFSTAKRPPPAPVMQPVLEAPPPPYLSLPDISVTAPATAPVAVPRAITRVAPGKPANSHFGAANDAGLGLDVGASAGGGAGARGSLAGFEAAVRRQVAAGKRQPGLAWDKRNTCVINYRVTVSRSGGLAAFSIDPCTIVEINEAARQAIRAAAPFPLPPDLGAPNYEVHGSLIFHP